MTLAVVVISAAGAVAGVGVSYVIRRVRAARLAMVEKTQRHADTIPPAPPERSV